MNIELNIKNVELKMKDSILSFNKLIEKYNLNLINLDIIYNLKIIYYNKNVKLSKLSNIVYLNRNSIKITLFDKSIKNKVRHLIENINLNLTTNVDNDEIIINLPPITVEYKKKILLLLNKDLEFYKIYIRNIRKNYNDKIKYWLKNKLISKDKYIFWNKNIQFLTNKYINNLDVICNKKIKSIV